MSGGGPDARAAALLDLLAGKARAQAVSTAAALGVADHLGDAPRDARTLADTLAVDADALERLLRILAGLGLLEEEPGRGFVLTDLGRTLRKDALGPLAAFVGAAEQWDPWARLRDALAGGGTAYARTHGVDLYEHLARDESAAGRYDAAVDAFTRAEVEALAAAFDFGAVGTVVDVGGGRGSALAALLERFPSLRGVLLDLPPVVARHGPGLRERFGERVECVGGSFRDVLPAGADVYVLKHVLHNWGDDDAVRLLAGCRDAMADGGRVLAIEGILLPGNRPDTAHLLDLEMLVLTGGRERRKPELRRLFAESGLALERVTRLGPLGHLLEGRRR
ncbi:MAG: methyltransferase [Planctomycetota bacterium JB042]